jgi:hypothetical protein
MSTAACCLMPRYVREAIIQVRVPHAKVCPKKTLVLSAIIWAVIAGGIAFAFAGCAEVAPDVAKISPAIAEGCAKWREAEASPAVRLALGAGTIAANVAMPGAGAVVADLRAYGDRFCAEGPPAGDVTSEPERASWLATLTGNLLSAAIKRL